MKVLKFGGTSVGSVQSISCLKNIVENEAGNQPVIVVVSALGGITDQLLATAKMAQQGDESYMAQLQVMRQRHHSMADTLVADRSKHDTLATVIDTLFDELKSIYYGVYLIRDLSSKTQNAIVSYGERLSSPITATMLDGAVLKDSREFIKTEQKKNKHLLDSSLTNRLIQETFAQMPRITVVPGFISSDKHTGETTNLGRGGSDYTASLIAAALDAEVLEI